MPDAKSLRALVDKKAHATPEPQGLQVEMAQVPFQLNSGRPALVAVPKDVTDLELLSFFGALLALGDQLRAMRPSSRIELPRGVKLPS